MSDDLRKAARELSYELDGVIADVEHGNGFDAVCLQTIKRVRDALAAPPPKPIREVTQEETCRESFEVWAIEYGYFVMRLPGGNEYAYSDTRRAWQAWQAAHAAGFEAGRKASDELAEALRKARTWIADREYGEDWSNEDFFDSSQRVALKRIDAILARIDGEKP